MATNENRSVVLKFLLHLHPPRIPISSARFTYTFGLGGLTLFSFLVTIITGIFLMFVYSPTPGSAHQSLQHIATVMPYGWYIRNLHYWAAQVMVIAAVLHMIRIALNGGYLRGRAFNWIIGIILLVFTFLMDFTGFPLRWDAESHWALVVGTNLLREIPFVGTGIYHLIVGGFEITGNTLLRFYSWHIFGLPFIALMFMVYHFYRIRKDGGISREESDQRPESISRETLLQKELIFLLLAASILIVLSAVFTPHLGISAETNPILEDVQAPWIFLGIQFLLRHFQPFLAGIVIPVVILLYWMSLPYLDNNHQAQGIWAPEIRTKFWLPFLVSILLVAVLMIAETVA